MTHGGRAPVDAGARPGPCLRIGGGARKAPPLFFVCRAVPTAWRWRQSSIHTTPAASRESSASSGCAETPPSRNQRLSGRAAGSFSTAARSAARVRSWSRVWASGSRASRRSERRGAEAGRGEGAAVDREGEGPGLVLAGVAVDGAVGEAAALRAGALRGGAQASVKPAPGATAWHRGARAAVAPVSGVGAAPAPGKKEGRRRRCATLLTEGQGHRVRAPA